jgi:hypothetical protein
MQAYSDATADTNQSYQVAACRKESMVWLWLATMLRSQIPSSSLKRLFVRS